MNAPPNIDPVTAHSDCDVVHWLTNDTRAERFIDNIFAELCVRLQRADIPVKRASLHFLISRPQWLGARIMWADGMREAELVRVDYDVRERSEYIDSPANEMMERHFSIGQKPATVVVACSRHNAVQRRPSVKSRAVSTRKLATLPGRWPRRRRSSNHPATGNVSKCCLRT